MCPYLHTINFTSYSVTEVGALSAAGWTQSVHGRHTTVGSGRGWLGVVIAWQADLSGRPGAMGHNGSVRLDWGCSSVGKEQ